MFIKNIEIQNNKYLILAYCYFHSSSIVQKKAASTFKYLQNIESVSRFYFKIYKKAGDKTKMRARMSTEKNILMREKEM